MIPEGYWQEKKLADIKYNQAKSLHDHAGVVLDLINGGHLEQAKEWLENLKSNSRFDALEADKEKNRIYDYWITKGENQ